MRKLQLANGEFYHVYNRGVDKRRIFLDRRDHLRMIHDLFEFNDRENVPNADYYFHKSPAAHVTRRSRTLLVEINAFCLMPNHFHLLLRQREEGGISLFLQKLGTGYVRYFNERYHRSGALFEGRFKAIHVDSDLYLTHLSRYIHLNPLEMKFPQWKNHGIPNIKEAEDFLYQYRWSSYPDYAGKKNFPSLTQRDFLLEYFENQENYKKFVLSWTKRDLETVSETILEE